MKKYFSFVPVIILLLICSNVFSQTLSKIEGAWENKDGQNQSILIFKGGYFTYAGYTANEFALSRGGAYTIDGKIVKIEIEFNSANSKEVGKQIEGNFSIDDTQLEISLANISIKYHRIDDGEAPLAGVWKISAREQDGKLVPIHQKGTRKTLKILTGKRFQWFAINPETKEFSGTGGGAYTFINGKYTENIDFFSRDNSRVGAKLTFDGKLQDGKWLHSGLSSKGEKIYEVWERVKY